MKQPSCAIERKVKNIKAIYDVQSKYLLLFSEEEMIITNISRGESTVESERKTEDHPWQKRKKDGRGKKRLPERHRGDGETF